MKRLMEDGDWLAEEGDAPYRGQCAPCIFRCSTRGDIVEDSATTSTCTIYVEPECKPEEILAGEERCPHYHPASTAPEALLLGLAIGDALGVPVEFRRRGTFHIEGMTGFGTYHQPPGTWSDDTSLALCLAASIESDGVNMEMLANNFVAWWEKGHFTPHGEVFDIGGATRRAIARLTEGVPPEKAGGRDIRDNGNGSLMRVAPLVFSLYGKTPRERYEIVAKVSSVTHGHPISITGCQIFLEYLRLLHMGRSPEVAYAELKQAINFNRDLLDSEGLKAFGRILEGNIAALHENKIDSGGYVVETLEASMWAFLNTRNYAEAVLKSVNLGSDTDTTGAVTGAMAGLHYGLHAIPAEWLKTLAKGKMIRNIATRMPRRELFPNT